MHPGYEALQVGLSSVAGPGLYVSLAVVLLCGSASAAAGIGGGGLFVPIFTVLLRLGPKCAVPVSKVAVLGVALGNNFGTFGVGQLFGLQNSSGMIGSKHPKAKEIRGVDKPLIDFHILIHIADFVQDTASFFQISLLFGTICGVALNHILPELIILVALSAVLCITGTKALRRGLKQYKEENSAHQYDSITDPVEETDEAGIVRPPAQAAVDDSMASATPVISSASLKPVAAKEPQKLKELLHSEEQGCQTFPVLLLAFLTLYVLVFTTVKDNVFGLHTKCEGTHEFLYWSWLLTPLLVFGVAMWYAKRRLLKIHKLREALDYTYINDPRWGRDIVWDAPTLCKVPPVGFLAGAMAGMLGIGGGMVTGPLLLSLGMNSHVSSATTSFMLIFTASSTTIQYVVGKVLPWDWALLFGLSGYIAGCFSSSVLRVRLQATGHPSYVVILLACIILISCTAMTFLSILEVSTATSQGLQYSMSLTWGSYFACIDAAPVWRGYNDTLNF